MLFPSPGARSRTRLISSPGPSQDLGHETFPEGFAFHQGPDAVQGLLPAAAASAASWSRCRPSTSMLVISYPYPSTSHRRAAAPASIANSGFLLREVPGGSGQGAGIAGRRLASSTARSKSPASLAAANHLPSSPGVLSTRSRRILSGGRSGYFLAMARKVAR